ncbi:hypothetical protein CXB51_003855 [Gossypium anomalum]|uniref:Aminotransferase-like plant mobile domain-containing protein n=1 Tax=Gossypium anomalum TaxID=47600 RepID=A0A8J5Z2X1_9ROSI|nr:hypothetical protein CXB51_003855 [Gossypium anomalum]
MREDYLRGCTVGILVSSVGIGVSDEDFQTVDRVLQCYIRNMSDPPSPLIENYLRETGFWHAATIGRGCKLDPKLISTLIERWRPETHTFHLSCGECTITLEDVQLQLELPVDGAAPTESIQFADWGAICYDLLSEIPDNIYGERIRYAQAYILEMIGGYLMSDLSLNLVHLRWLLKLVDFRAVGELSWRSAVLATLYLEMYEATPPNKAKIGGCLSLLQSWAQFHFPFLCPRDPAIRAIIPKEFFQNPNIWHVKVPLVNYFVVEMHKTDRVLRQFGFRQPIPEEPEYDYILDREPIIISELACTPDYMPWFGIYGKPYLLSEEQRHRQIRVERE